MAGSPTRRRRWSGGARQLSRDGARLRFCYEAGRCGYGIQRQLSGLGHDCVVVLCQEGARAPCCTRDEGRPFGAVL